MILGGGCVRSWCNSAFLVVPAAAASPNHVFRYNTPLFYDLATHTITKSAISVPGMLLRHSAHVFVDHDQHGNPLSTARICILMGGAFCFSFGCNFSPCYQMRVPLLAPPNVRLQDPSTNQEQVEFDVVLVPKASICVEFLNALLSHPNMASHALFFWKLAFLASLT
jgi:hypothetical protein